MKKFDDIYKELNSEEFKKDKTFKEAKKKKEKQLSDKMASFKDELENLEEELTGSIIDPHRDTFSIKVEVELKKKEIELLQDLINNIFGK